MRTIGELRAALTMGYGFPGDADDFEADLAREINYSDPADLTGVVRLVGEFRGRVIARQDPELDTAVDSAVAEIRAARGTEIFGTTTKVATADAVKRRKRESFLGWLAEGGLPNLTGTAEGSDDGPHQAT
jgi:hypothetical protein